jgi:hypothetical protein
MQTKESSLGDKSSHDYYLLFWKVKVILDFYQLLKMLLASFRKQLGISTVGENNCCRDLTATLTIVWHAYEQCRFF